MLYDLTVRQINKAKTAEKLADLKKKVNVFYLVDQLNEEEYKGLIAMIEEKENTLSTIAQLKM